MTMAVDRLKSLYENWGGSAYTINEPVTIAGHSQEAAKLALEAGERQEVIAAALFHDCGHLLGFEAGLPAEMDGCGFEQHHSSGADFLTKLGFSRDVAYLVEHHVAAKRYLVAVDPTYELSPASATTLHFQGGPMTKDEIARCDSDARWPEVLRLRKYDEAAKNDDQELDLDAWNLEDVLTSKSCWVLSQEQLRKWDSDGYLVIPKAATKAAGFDAVTLDEMARTLAADDFLPKYPGALVHRERTTHEIQLCRVENFATREPQWVALTAFIRTLVDQVFRRPSVLFKDKVNFKGPGGAGFHWHQDATAYPLATRHVSALVAIDAATADNGALQVAPRSHDRGIIDHTNGVIPDDSFDDDDAVLLRLHPGDVVLFDSFLPHKSNANATSHWRRSAYLTFNPASEGDFHAAYYAKKAQSMQKGSISLTKDFAGVIVD